MYHYSLVEKEDAKLYTVVAIIITGKNTIKFDSALKKID